jgi:hypothetical protein
MTPNTIQPTLSTYLAEPLRLGDPDIAGSLAVFPVFGPEPEQAYTSFANGRSRGVVIKELESGASVSDLVIQNPTDTPVLLYEGEEVLGAQQNRTFDVTVLVAAGAALQVPVTCVEAGRWDYTRHGESFQPAPQAAYPELRRAKSRQVRERVAAGMDARASQQAVWTDVDDKSRRHGSRSRTGAMHDVFEARRGRLNELTGAVQLHDRQLGALVAIEGKFAILDLVSRPDVFVALHRPLVQGYALDALEADETEGLAIDEARGFVSLVSGVSVSERDGIGLGRELRFAADGVAGSGLVTGNELIQLTAFPESGDSVSDGPSPRGGRIRRPSSRRI